MPFPRDETPDATTAFLKEGYEFAANRQRALQSDVFRTRLTLRPITVVSGRDAAEMFYTPGRFTRAGAVPETVVTLLQDHGSVQALDGAAHDHRKAMWMRMVASDAAVDRLVDAVTRRWQAAFAEKEGTAFTVQDEAEKVLTAAALDWAGLPADEDLDARRAELALMVRGAGSVGADQVKGQLLRQRSEHWARRQVEIARDQGPDERPLSLIAHHQDRDGTRLSTKDAGVELLNVLRPVVAIAWYLTFLAKALAEHPAWRDRIAGAPEDALLFVQEIRRLAPFFPAIGGKVREPFTWRDERFEEGDWVLLDIYGTGRDARSWDAPEQFDPDRFVTSPPPGAMAPQGAGPHETTHRCPGEKATLAVMAGIARHLASARWTLAPDQDLTVPLNVFPTGPVSGVVLDVPAGQA